MNILRKRQAPARTPVERAYIATYGGPISSPRHCLGISFDLETIKAEVLRDWIQRVEHLAAPRWAATDDLENIRPASIHSVPVNTIITRRRDITVLYTDRFAKRTPYWGRAGLQVTQREIDERNAREDYRTTHRDRVDPLRAVIDSAQRDLAKSPRNRDHRAPAYVFDSNGPWRPQFGIFTSYRPALAAAPAGTSIYEVPVDGRTRVPDGRIVRGWINYGWGYASGFAPEPPENSPAVLLERP